MLQATKSTEKESSSYTEMLKELNDMQDIDDSCKTAVINNKFLRQNGDIADLQDWQTLYVFHV